MSERPPGPTLRSADWFSDDGMNGFLHRSWLKNQGHPDRMFDGRPVIGICSTASDLAPCNGHLRELAEVVKRGVYEAGGLPLEFPVTSLGETIIRPTTMLLRNLVSMDVEESIRGNPMDGVVLVGGCDKTTPALLMGAASCDLPVMVVTGGPMLTGRFRGRPIGSGTDVFAMSEEVRAGTMSPQEFRSAESCMSRSAGHCNTMGTASSMSSVVEALGLGLPGVAAIPAVDARRRVLAHDTGVRIVELVRQDVRMSHVVTAAALENAVRVNAAVGGSTNVIIHLLALAGRLEIPLDLDDIHRWCADVPVLVDLKPIGEHLMEDFFEAGGVQAVIRQLGELIRDDTITVAGPSLRRQAAEAPHWDRVVIRDRDDPVHRGPALAVLRGTLAPDGALIKVPAASAELLTHRGPALVFADQDDLLDRIDDPELDVTADTVLVLRSAGPRGYPGMPELGNLPLPRRLLQQGIRDVVRISDARMSGTAYGTVVLHVSPESAVGGPLALVRDGDLIELDVPGGRLDLLVDRAELERRRAGWSPPAGPTSGYRRMYVEHVGQADTGVDLDFLVGRRGSEVHGDNH